VELEVPLVATVAWLKREIMRRSAHQLLPSMQTLKLNNDGEPDGDILLVDEGDGHDVRRSRCFRPCCLLLLRAHKHAQANWGSSSATCGNALVGAGGGGRGQEAEVGAGWGEAAQS
jgi:hypothetical protein